MCGEALPAMPDGCAVPACNCDACVMDDDCAGGKVCISGTAAILQDVRSVQIALVKAVRMASVLRVQMPVNSALSSVMEQPNPVQRL